MKMDPANKAGLPAQIAEAIRDAIVSGRMIVDQRLPSEAELAEQFAVSRPTVREALKRLAAQSLIRTQRGAFGGAFVNRLSYAEAYGQHITTSTLLLSMNAVSFETACEARYALERACAPLACARRGESDLAAMRAELRRQSRPGLSDEVLLRLGRGVSPRLRRCCRQPGSQLPACRRGRGNAALDEHDHLHRPLA